MTNKAIASRLVWIRPIVKDLGAALKDFQASGSKFRILKTVHPTNPIPQEPSPSLEHESPKTLFILDSSFNPPSIAHRSLAQSALSKSSCSCLPTPHRLLLLFATMNADKAPSAAAFDQRLTMMSIFAGDLLESLKANPDKFLAVPVDIGVTTVPYYTDKSAAIESEGSRWYPSRPKHVHLVGFDTLTRFFAAKYYKDFDPPFSALEPYFERGHQLRATLRPDDDYGSVDEQRAFVQKLENGEMESDGGKREWATQITLVPPNPRTGVSSTKVRKAAKQQDWAVVRDLCTPGVAAWLADEHLYDEDDQGAKMA